MVTREEAKKVIAGIEFSIEQTRRERRHAINRITVIHLMNREIELERQKTRLQVLFEL